MIKKLYTKYVVSKTIGGKDYLIYAKIYDNGLITINPNNKHSLFEFEKSNPEDIKNIAKLLIEISNQ